MKKLLAGLCMVGMFAVVGCGGDDDEKGGDTSTPIAGCNAFADATCKKIFGCFDEAVLDLLAEQFGNNESDCKTKLKKEGCTEAETQCDSGTSYDAAAANECLKQFNALSCDELSDPSTATPAACEDDSVCH
jgi:hypothetical protein